MYDAGAFLPSVRYAPDASSDEVATRAKREVRDAVKALFPEGVFKEIHVQCDLEECKGRDPKGLYQRAASGEIKDFTGVSAPYEKPLTPDLTIDSIELQPTEAVRVIKRKLL
jgi:adenylylsulfate kinase